MAFNEGIHHHLLDLGYTYIHNEADWWEEGSAESGPILRGGPAWDCYDSEQEYLAVDKDGSVHGPYPQDPPPPEWLVEMVENWVE